MAMVVQMVNDPQKTFLSTLFDPTDIVGYRESVFKTSPIPHAGTQFFCINPFKSLKDFTLENISIFRNFLIEIDDRKLDAQTRLIEKRLQMPFTTKAYSGGKSFHYIISLEIPLTSLKEYREYASLIYNVVKVMDPRCGNANRLSRLAGAFRDSGEEQTLEVLNSRVSKEDLDQWIFQINGAVTSKMLAEREFNAQRKQLNGGTDQLSHSTIALLERGEVRQGLSRHEALTSAAVNMLYAGISIADIEQRLTNAALLLGVDGRGDVPGIISWLERNF